MSEHDDRMIGDRLRRAADELASHHARAPAHLRATRWARPGWRFVAVGVPVATLALVVGLVASQMQPGTGSLFRADATSPASVQSSTPEPAPEDTTRPTPSSSPTPTPEGVPSREPTPDGREPVVTPAPSRPTESRCRPAPEVPRPGSIDLTVAAAVDRAAPTERVAFTVRMRNDGPLPVHNQRSGQEYDFLVRGPDGDVWLWSNDKAFIQPLISEQYAPGEERTFREGWYVVGNCGQDERVPPGTYTVRALWMTSGGGEAWWSDPVEFRID